MAKGFAQPLTAGPVPGRLAWPAYEDVASVPWWAWFGGVLGGCLIIAQLLIARQIGAGAFLGLLVTAGVVTSILLDHFGWVSFAVHPASLWRILGGILMIGGVARVALF